MCLIHTCDVGVFGSLLVCQSCREVEDGEIVAIVLVVLTVGISVLCVIHHISYCRRLSCTGIESVVAVKCIGRKCRVSPVCIVYIHGATHRHNRCILAKEIHVLIFSAIKSTCTDEFYTGRNLNRIQFHCIVKTKGCITDVVKSGIELQIFNSQICECRVVDDTERMGE